MPIDRKRFFDAVRSSLFGGRLKQSQVDAMNAILDEWERRRLADLRQLAYVLATARHEAGKDMKPVREAFGRSAEETIRKLETAWAAGKLPRVRRPYWRRDAEGKAWFGRGLVQLTHKENYVRLGDRLGIGLAEDPDLALSLHVAVKVLIVGMVDGLFTGHKLADYIGTSRCDYVQARRIVNGLDRAALVAGFAQTFEAALRAAKTIGGMPPSEIEAPPQHQQQPARPALVKVVIGLLIAAAAAVTAWLKTGG